MPLSCENNLVHPHKTYLGCEKEFKVCCLLPSLFFLLFYLPLFSLLLPYLYFHRAPHPLCTYRQGSKGSVFKLTHTSLKASISLMAQCCVTASESDVLFPHESADRIWMSVQGPPGYVLLSCLEHLSCWRKDRIGMF